MMGGCNSELSVTGVLDVLPFAFKPYTPPDVSRVPLSPEGLEISPSSQYSMQYLPGVLQCAVGLGQHRRKRFLSA